jgi:polar amino acid transport system permease protein
MVDFSVWDIFRNLLLAARWTVALSLIAFIGGGLVGLALLIARMGKSPWAERLVGGYVQIFQGTPLLMQLFLAYFGLALFGIKTSAWVAASLALTLYTSAFLAEIWRGCVAGFIELTKAGTMITNATFKPFVVYSCVALLYFALCFPISLYAKGLERKLNVHR